jgi:hypothetical protein
MGEGERRPRRAPLPRMGPQRPHLSAEDRNHFGPWRKATSPQNIRLLYGMSSIFNGERRSC